MYFILDCNGNIVGNRFGYHTFKAADGQVKRDKSPAAKALWNAYFDKYGSFNPLEDTLACHNYCTIKAI